MVSAAYPFAGHYLYLDGHKLHYVDEGVGSPVICLHGNPTWSYMYRNLIPALASSHRVIAPDHIGCGRSDKPNQGKYSYSLTQRVKDLDRLITSLNLQEPVSLVVHDWGGMIGLAWAVENHDRVNRLVVMNTAAFPLPSGKRMPWQLRLGRNRWLGPPLIRGLNLFCRGAAKHCVVRKPLSSETRAAFLAPYDSWTNRVAVEQFVRTIPIDQSDAAFSIVARTDNNLAKLVNKPLLLAWGLRDFVFDVDFLREWQSRFPKAECIALDDVGHYLLEDAGEELIPRIVSFLNP